MISPLRLLAVFAHPDDESMGVGGTLAKYAAEGVGTYLVCATRGERGWFGPEGQNPGFAGLAKTRTHELHCAGAKLGLRAIHFLDYTDGDLDRADQAEAVGKIVSHIRSLKPHVIVTFLHDGDYGHPDHIAISQLTSAAIVCAADSSYRDPLSLPSHRVSKLYYQVDSQAFANLIMPHVGEISFQVDDQLRGETPWKEWMITTRIDVSNHWKTGWDAILCHQSQLPSIGPLTKLPQQDIRQILTLRGTFYRVFSLVNGGRQVETDLFEGLR